MKQGSQFHPGLIGFGVGVLSIGEADPRVGSVEYCIESLHEGVAVDKIEAISALTSQLVANNDGPTRQKVFPPSHHTD